MSVLMKVETTDNPKLLRVELASASEMEFEIVVLGGKDGFEKTFKDICDIAPVMTRLDADLMEMYDNAARTSYRQEDLIALQRFVASHSFGDINLPFSAFDAVRR